MLSNSLQRWIYIQPTLGKGVREGGLRGGCWSGADYFFLLDSQIMIHTYFSVGYVHESVDYLTESMGYLKESMDYSKRTTVFTK